jgi:ATP-dependent Clp protease ATP-binding subunit ClpA
VYESFSDAARQVLVLAGEEARDLGHDHIATEHLLLGILRFERAPGLTDARSDAVRAFGRGGTRTMGELLLTGAAKRALQQAQRDAGDDPVRPEHLLAALRGRRTDDGDRLLSMAADATSVTARALAALGVEHDALHRAVEAVRTEAPPRPGRFQRG